MKPPFLVAVFALALLLVLIPYSKDTVSDRRLTALWLKDPTLRAQLQTNCTLLKSATGNSSEILFLENFATLLTEGPGKMACTVSVVTAFSDRFQLTQTGEAQLLLKRTDTEEKLLFEKLYHLDAPMMLSLLPILLLPLAMFFSFPHWTLPVCLASFCFCLAGASIPHAVTLFFTNLWLAIKTDRILPGALLTLVWVGLLRSKPLEKAPVIDKTQIRKHLAITSLLGIWNPVFFTILSPLTQPFQSTWWRLRGLLNWQFLILCLSFYLFGFQWSQPFHSLADTLLLPRYFSFAAVFTLFLHRSLTHPPQFNLIWRLPRFRETAIALAICELLSFFIPSLRSVPTFTRWGLVLLLAQCPIRLSAFDRQFFSFVWKPCLATIIVYTFGMMASREGVLDLVVSVLDPRANQTTIVFMCFLAGMALGFFGGGVSALFFGLYTLVIHTHDLPLIKASLTDGILLGTLVSPFSIFNVLTASLYSTSVADIIRIRFRLLGVPMLMGASIYLLSSITTVAILRPATFIFLCFVQFYWKLYRADWDPKHLWRSAST